MYKNKSGYRIRVARAMQRPHLTQDDLVARLQVEGTYISKNVLSRIELGERYVTDLELIAFSKVLGVSTSWLLEETNNTKLPGTTT